MQTQTGAEQAFLGCLLCGEGLEHSEGISQEDFYDPKHVIIFKGIRSVIEAGEKVDPISVMRRIELNGDRELYGGATYLAELNTFGWQSSSVETYQRMVRSFSIKRKLSNALRLAATMSVRDDCNPADIMAKLETEFADLQDKGSKDLVPIGAFSGSFEQRLTDIENGARGILGFPTGFSDLDERTSGLVRGELSILAARPAMGKTAFAMECLINAANSGTAGLFISLEMSGEAIYARLACSLARVDLLKFRTGMANKYEINELRESSAHIKEVSVYLVDSAYYGSDLASVRAAIRKAVRKYRVGVVVVDYLQLMNVRGHRGTRENEISQVANGLKSLSRELDIHIMALSQLSRACEQRDNKRPLLSDLRESGAIEQAADLVAGIYRDEYYRKETADQGVAEVIIMKQRNGPTDTVKVQFTAAYAKFGNLDRNRQDPEDHAPMERQETWSEW